MKALLAGAAVVAGAVWWGARTHPSAFPYAGRLLLDFTHPFITRERLVEVLEPRRGERILEIGPGTGYYSLSVAELIRPDGRLTVLDVQQEYLDHTMGAASTRGLTNIEPVLADATALPFSEDAFDGAYLVTVLGEVPDGDSALRELRRVVKPDGRIVFGETPLDPHLVTLASLRRRGLEAGLRFEHRSGGPLGWFASFTPA
jgi:ubiquinone/menaquinone biosynthesis C-methylase UbiE